MTSEYVRLPAIARPDTINPMSIALVAKKETNIESLNFFEKRDTSSTTDISCATKARIEKELFIKEMRVMTMD